VASIFHARRFAHVPTDSADAFVPRIRSPGLAVKTLCPACRDGILFIRRAACKAIQLPTSEASVCPDAASTSYTHRLQAPPESNGGRGAPARSDCIGSIATRLTWPAARSDAAIGCDVAT